MLHWIPYAFVRITVCFIAGILVAVFLGSNGVDSWLMPVSLAMVVLYFLAFFLLRRSFFSHNPLIAIVGFTTIFLFGYLSVYQADQTRSPEHIIHHAEKTTYYLATLQNPGEERAKSIRFEAEIEGIKRDGQWQQSTGKIYLYVDKKQQLKYGDQLLIKGRPGAIPPPANPGEFDYKRFLNFKSIYHQHFLRSGDFQVAGNTQNPVLAFAYKSRAWASNVLAANIDSDRELGIVQALVLGIKDDLDDDTRQAYAATGAIHVLAVSGLHVGIIYGIVLFLLGRFQTSRHGRWMVAITCILALWFYAMITGFSPSVLRAATMFSFMIIGRASSRDCNIYNTLAVSAFFLLLYDPYLIMSLGFQLSYLAVLGIVYVQPKVYGLYVPDHVIVDKLWAITSVALAAQLATVPLCLLYFHQFPSYFFLSNIIVIPGATIVLCLGLAVIAFSFIEVVATAIGWLLKWCVFGINEVIFAIRELPFSQIKDVSISTTETVLIFGIIISFLIFFHGKKLGYAWCALILAIAFCTLRVTTLYTIPDKITVYKINGHTAVDFITAGNSFLYTDAELDKTDPQVSFHIRPNHLLSGVSQMHWLYEGAAWIKAVNNMHLAHFKNHNLAILDNPIPGAMVLTVPVKVDYVLVCKKFDKGLAWVRDNFTYKKIILDGSLSWYQVKKLKKEAEALALPYYSVYDNGAYELELN